MLSNPPIPPGMRAEKYVLFFPEHTIAKQKWPASDAISRFLDWARSQGVELCCRHTHTDACYRAFEETLVFAGVVCGVPGKQLVCGLKEAFYPLDHEAKELMAKYFGIDLAAYDLEEQQLRRLRDPENSGPGRA